MEFPPRSNGGGNASTSRTRASVVAQTLTSKEVYFYSVYTTFIFASLHFSGISALQAFNVSSTSYDCSSNMICLQDAHVYTGQNNTNGIQVGSLSLIHEGLTRHLGVAYYNKSIQLLDRSTQQMASFSTSFVIDTVWDTTANGSRVRGGDGMAFVISADNITTGEGGGSFGIFTNVGLTRNKSIVVEFDSYSDPGPPVYDINDNHVSIDLANITASAVANASDVMVDLGGNSTRYAWVEYSKETQQLEVRVSNNGSRPVLPLLTYTLELSGFVEEYMWVGFSSGSSAVVSSNYYIGNWTFESYAILESTESKSDRVMKLGLVLGLSVGLGAFLLVCIVIFLLVQRYSGGSGCYMNCPLRSTISEEEDMSTPIKGMPERFSYKQLSMATKAFSEESKLGQGAFGSVYFGVLPSSGIPVAVKRLKGESAEGERDFMAEISIISQLRHRNLIQLMGWCKDASRRKYYLVYELMPNGSLDKVLFGPTEQQRPALSWTQRFNIVSGTAAALEYLHQGWTRQVIHRDVKPSNIMLDKDWNAKLGDFGLARLVDHHREGGTTVVAGTLGYLAPEILVSGKFTDKTDVYAFGVVVLEVACGRKALSYCVPEDQMVLVDWVRRRLNEDNLFSTVDKRLENYDTYWMEVLLIIGLQCSHSDPLVRPSMRHVVQVLAGDVPAPLLPDFKPSLLLGNVQSARMF